MAEKEKEVDRFNSKKERKEASRLLDEPEPPKKGIGDKVSKIKKKMNKKREEWTTHSGVESTPPSLPKTAAAGYTKPQTQTNTGAGSQEPHKNKKDADSTESLKKESAGGPQPKPRYSTSSVVTSTPARSAEGVLAEGVLGLDLSEANATTYRDPFIVTDDKNPFDGSLEKVDTRTAKQLNKASKTKPFRSIKKTNWLKYEELMTGKLAHLKELVKLDNRITLSSVPGHEGHMGNEVADRLAKRGADQTVQGPAPWVPAANCVQKRLLNNWRDVRCEEKWKNREDCRQSELMMPNIKNKWSKIILRKPKTQIKVMVQLETGHANLRRHRFLMKLEDSPLCECGEEEEMSIHTKYKHQQDNEIRQSNQQMVERPVKAYHQ